LYSIITCFREAGVYCELVTGVVKAASYIPGESTFDSLPHSGWVAHRCNNTYHLTNPTWVTSCLVGNERGGEVVLEIDGDSVLTETTSSSGFTISSFENFWFCTNPSIFILHCFPDDDKWQLLPGEKKSSCEEFATRLTPESSFFEMELEVLSADKCTYKSENGRCWVDIKVVPARIKSLHFMYKLAFVSESGDMSEVNAADFPQLVMKTQTPDSVSFEVRCPVAGDYMLTIFAGMKEEKTKCFEIRIHCLSPDPACRKLPIDPGHLGFGFNSTAVDVGLSHPSFAHPTLKVQSSDTLEKKEKLKFKVDHDMIDDYMFSSDIIGDEVEEAGLSQ